MGRLLVPGWKASHSHTTLIYPELVSESTGTSRRFRKRRGGGGGGLVVDGVGVPHASSYCWYTVEVPQTRYRLFKFEAEIVAYEGTGFHH